MARTKKLKPTADETETLAIWLHETCCRELGVRGLPYAGLSANSKTRYRLVAWELLRNPPQVLIDAVWAKGGE